MCLRASNSKPIFEQNTISLFNRDIIWKYERNLLQW
jgi:hypothetical protein